MRYAEQILIMLKEFEEKKFHLCRFLEAKDEMKDILQTKNRKRNKNGINLFYGTSFCAYFKTLVDLM